MIQFRKKKHDVSGFITIQFRMLKHSVIGSSVVVQTPHEWTEWQDIPVEASYG